MAMGCLICLLGLYLGKECQARHLMGQRTRGPTCDSSLGLTELRLHAELPQCSWTELPLD